MGAVRFEGHAVYPAPTAEVLEDLAGRWGCSAVQAAERFARVRAEMIAREQGDGFNFPFVPRIWTVVWSLLDWRWWPKALVERVEAEFGCDLWTFMRRMRESLGFADGPVSCVWVSGANRAGKTEMVSFMANAMMAALADQYVYVLSTSEGDSVQAGLHQKLFRYIPRMWRSVGKGETGYVSYKLKNGFAGNSYVLPNGSVLGMKFYSQDAEEAGEGWEANAIFADESIPGDWWQRLPARVSSRNGFVVLTNTPQSGYTDVVHEFMGGCEVTRWGCGFMLPKDGGEGMKAQTLGLDERGFAELMEAHAARPVRAARVPECVSEDCWGWLREEGKDWRSGRRRLEDAPAVQVGGRLFEAVPRVGRVPGGRKAVVWFHSADNPFGYPRNLVNEMAGVDAERVRCRLYGVVTPSQVSVFTRFKRDVHVVKASEVPVVGTRYLMMDPAPGRNMFLVWLLMAGNRRYFYREFPSGYVLPDVGVPGRWARLSGRKNGENDGGRGEGASPFGWGVARYKALLAFLEGWEGWDVWAQVRGAGPGVWPRGEVGDSMWPTVAEMAGWRDPVLGGAGRERIYSRLMDPRGGGAVHLATEGVSTPLGDFNEMGVAVDAAFSGTVMSGVDAMISAMDYSPGKGSEFFVCEDCVNVIDALERWKNLDGEGSATKDPIDCMRYAFSSGCRDVAGCAGGRARGSGEGRRYGVVVQDAGGGGGLNATGQRCEGGAGGSRRRMRVRVC